jgi:hypothetical protein
MSKPKTLGELRAKAHFFVIAPAEFTCGFTEQAIDLLKSSKVPYIVQKVTSLEQFVLPAYPDEPVNVAACLTKSKQMEAGDGAGETCSICKHLDCLLEKGGAHLLATNITDGFPQVFAYQPDKQLYAYIGHWGKLEKQFEKWQKTLFPAVLSSVQEKTIDAHDMYAQHTDVLNAINSLDDPKDAPNVDQVSLHEAEMIESFVPEVGEEVDEVMMQAPIRAPEEYIGRAPQTYVIDAVDKALFEQWKRETGRIPASWSS